jgi:hypothetical protein
MNFTVITLCQEFSLFSLILKEKCSSEFATGLECNISHAHLFDHMTNLSQCYNYQDY